MLGHPYKMNSTQHVGGLFLALQEKTCRWAFEWPRANFPPRLTFLVRIKITWFQYPKSPGNFLWRLSTNTLKTSCREKNST